MNYHYDGDSGSIIRVVASHWGPAQRGAIGSMTSTGALLTNVRWDGKTWAIQLHRLAAYLKTGLQYKHIVFRDGVKSNLKWSNLLCGDIMYTSSAQIAEKELVRQQSKQRLMEVQEKARVEFEKSKGTFGPGTRFLRDNPTGRLETPVVEVKATKAGALYDQLMQEYVKVRYKLGFFTGAENNSVMDFLREGRPHSQWKSLHDVPPDMIDPMSEKHKSLNKWEQDYILALRFEQALMAGRDSEQGFHTNVLGYYDFDGLKVIGDYNELPQEQLDMVEKVRKEETQ